MRFHDLRYKAATLAQMQDVHPNIVSDMVGHGTVGLMLDSNSLLTMRQQAASAMDAILSGQAGRPLLSPEMGKILQNPSRGVALFPSCHAHCSLGDRASPALLVSSKCGIGWPLPMTMGRH